MSATRTSSIGFHEGRALVHHIAGSYQGLFEVLLELVQNALDAGARHIRVAINEQDNTAIVQDNGAGCEIDEFESGLSAICETRKQRGKGFFGRFGIGSVSPLGKCGVFHFTSCPSSRRTPYLRWTFETDLLLSQRSGLSVPRTERKDLVFTPRAPSRRAKRGRQHVTWRTEVRLEKITADRTKGRVDVTRLRDAIEERYGSVIRRRRVKIKLSHINYKGVSIETETRPQAFRGRKLEVIEINDTDDGITTLTLYVAPQTIRGRGGKVVVGERDDPFRLSFGRFAFFQRAIGLSSEVVAALTSGVFEGEITHDRITLTPSRTNFEQNDALINFCASIEEWFQKHGKRHLDEVQRQRQDKRLQELGLRSLRTLEALLKKPGFEALRGAIGSMRMGTVGKGHAPVPSGKVGGEQEVPALATTGGHGTPRTPKGGRGHEPADEERESHTPLAVLGPQGRARVGVRANSLGLQIGYIEDTSGQLWVIDRTHGVIYFNTVHPAWKRCDDQGDDAVVRLQNHLVVIALVCEQIPQEWSLISEMVIQELSPPVAELIAVESPRGKHKKP